MLTGNLHAPEIDMIRTSEVVVSSRHAALHVLVDGELRLLKPPLRYTIKPRALTVLAAPP
jgi:diacylglycerol kinase family enzyme